MLNVIFLCYVVNPEKTNKCSGLSVAGNKMQTGIIKYLSKYSEINLYVISVRPIAPFPSDKRIYLSKETGSVYGVSTEEIPFINIPLIKQLSQAANVSKSLNNTIRGIESDKTIVFTYNMYPQIGKSAIKAMKRFGVRVVSLIADLPIDYAKNRGVIGNLLYKKYNKTTERLIGQVHNIIVLNKHAIDLFAPQAEDFIVIDGGVDISDTQRIYRPTALDYKEKNLLYCGSLHRYSGALALAKSMSYIKNQDVVLDIYGSGEDKEKIIELSKKDSRIRYYGLVDNETIMKKQKEAFLLVNPRPVNDPISQVTFPSKTFEYMLSGTPVLSTRLNGLTEEYNNKLIFIEDDSEEGIASGIKKVLETSDVELLSYAQEAYKFVVEERNWEKQTRVIKNYLEKCAKRI